MMLAEHAWEALGSTSSAKKIRILNVLPYGENRSLPTTADLNVDLNKHILCLNRPYFGIHSSSLRLNLQTCQAAIFFFYKKKNRFDLRKFQGKQARLDDNGTDIFRTIWIFQLLRMKREEESQPANKSEESASKGTVAEGTQMPRLVPSSEEQQSWATFFTPGLSPHPYFCRVDMLLKTHFWGENLKIIDAESQIEEPGLHCNCLSGLLLGSASQGTQAQALRMAQGEQSHHPRDAAHGTTFNSVILKT